MGDHLQRALHLHQAVEWRAALGQRKPARRERHLGGRGSVTHIQRTLISIRPLSLVCHKNKDSTTKMMAGVELRSFDQT